MALARSYAEVVALATSKGGRCLSAPAEFTSTQSVLRFACAAGHEWQTRVTNLLHRDRWCPVCGSAHSPPLTLADVQQMAIARGGTCLSPVYLGIHRPHLFRCGAGHEWEAQPANLRHRGSWCPICAVRPKALAAETSVQRLSELQALAQARLGRCLSTAYRGDKVHLLFECADGHQWWATPNTIKRPHWCPRCRHGQPKNEVVTGMARELPPAPVVSRRGKEIQRVLKAVAGKPNHEDSD